MNIRSHWFHALVGQNEHGQSVQVMRHGEILKLHWRHGDTTLEQWHGQTVNMAQMLIRWLGIAALEHQRIADHQTNPSRPAIPLDARLLHVVERVHQHATISRPVGLRDDWDWSGGQRYADVRARRSPTNGSAFEPYLRSGHATAQAWYPRGASAA